MARSCVVPVVELINLREHPNASLMGLADVLGYQIVIGLVEDPEGPIVRQFLPELDDKGRRVPVPDGEVPDNAITVRFKFQYNEGDKVVYFPADVLIPDGWAEKFGVKHLLASPDQSRVKKIALRGEPSYGLVVPLPEDADWDLNNNVANYYGVTKYEPPVKTTEGDAAPYRDHIDPYLEKYTDIENGRIFMDIFKEGEEVVATEKIHGGNSRVGKINGEYVAASMELIRARPLTSSGEEAGLDSDIIKNNIYWHPFSNEAVRKLIDYLSEKYKAVILYGEVFGKVQKLRYGRKGLDYRAFDIRLDGRFLNCTEKYELFYDYGILTVPVLYQGPYSYKKIAEISNGDTTLITEGETHIREGVVVTPVVERTNPKIGRVILKYIGDAYEMKFKGGRHDTRDV